jgi:isopentenyldiphosphate isomerase
MIGESPRGKPMVEYLDVVDEDDRVVGRRTSRDCLEEGLLHRAVIIFLRDTKGRAYLKKRSSSMSWYPSHWSASCTGHVSSEESYHEGAKRELKEELGLECELVQVGKFLSPKWKYKEIVEWGVAVFFRLSPVIGYHCLYAHSNYSGRVPPGSTTLELNLSQS